MNNPANIKKPSLPLAIGTLAAVVALMTTGMIVFKASLQIMLFLSWVIVIPVGLALGHGLADIENAAYEMMRKILQPSTIILAVGAMIGVWIMAGTVPTLIYLGLSIISPKFFLLTALLFCSIISLFTGTSWGTMGTAGVAMMGIGAGLGVPPGMTAGAVICGAYFGDKMSPISDSTNLAPALAGAKVMNHIKHMLWTTIPSYLITAVIFTVLGFTNGTIQADTSTIATISAGLSAHYKLGFVPLIPALLVFYMLFTNRPPVSALLVGAIAAVVIAIAYQGHTIQATLACLYSGNDPKTGIAFIDSLLKRGGVTSMYGIVGLFFFALGLGGMLNHIGILETILASFAHKITSVPKLIVSTMAVSYISNMIGATISFAAVMTGTLMQPMFRKMRVRPENLSRVIEDCGTLGGPIIPWNTGAVYAAGVLGIAPSLFIPFCFLCFINPIISLIYGLTGFSITKLDKNEVYGETNEYKFSPFAKNSDNS